jgi:hypothetical protein
MEKELNLKKDIYESIRPYKLTQKQKSLCELWKSSGLKASEFCKQHKLAMSTFYGWCQKLWPHPKKASRKKFIPVITSAITTEIDKVNQANIEIVLPNQAIIRVNLPTVGIATFIQELCYASTIIR